MSIIKADEYYIKNLQKILDEKNIDENPRPKYKDGVDAHSYFITQVFEEYDISKGEFPITTLRNTAIKTGIKELLVIYQQQLNTSQGFKDNGVDWWEPWMNKEGNIGRSYSYNLESHRPNEMKKLVVKIEPRIVDKKYSELLDINKTEIYESIDGKIYKSNYRNYGEYIIIDKFYNEGHNYVKCQFLNTGYITTLREDSLKKGQHPKNDLIRTNLNIGYLDFYGDLNFTNLEIKKLHNIWTKMLRRCYSKNYTEYYSEIFVHQNWHSFRNFLLDIRFVPQYHLAKESNFLSYELDKDYYGSNCYSLETCVFLNKSENTIYKRNQIKPIKVIDDNKEYYELSYTSLSKTLGLSRGYVRNLVKRGYYKNIKFEEVQDNNLYRYELSRNQINSLLSNLKKDKYSRRHIISFWNWSNIDKKELVECAYETIWTVRKSNDVYYLDMTLIQRSNDYIMAGYINKIQYVALQMMVASHLGYQVGKFCHYVHNLHIYDRHVDAAHEILERIPLIQQPKIELETNKSFYDITLNDFKISNIEGIQKIKSELEIAI